MFVTYKSCVSHNSKTNKGDLIKFHRKVKQKEKVCRAQNLGSNGQGRGYEGHRLVTYKSFVIHNPKTSKGNLIKLHRKVKQNENAHKI